MTSKQIDLTKNFFALGLMFWLYERSMDPTIAWIDEKFGARPVIAEANKRALKAGYAFGETTEIFHTHYRVAPAQLPAGHVPQHHRQRGDRPRASSPRRRLADRDALLRLLPDHAGQRHPPPAVRRTRTSASRRSRPRTRSPRSAPRSAPRTAARSA